MLCIPNQFYINCEIRHNYNDTHVCSILTAMHTQVHCNVTQVNSNNYVLSLSLLHSTTVALMLEGVGDVFLHDLKWGITCLLFLPSSWPKFTKQVVFFKKKVIVNTLVKKFGAMHFIYQINRLTTTKVD